MIDMDSIIDISNSNTNISRINLIHCWREKNASLKKPLFLSRVFSKLDVSTKGKHNFTEISLRSSLLKE